MGGAKDKGETEQEKELGKVFADEWAIYQDEVVPEENKVIADARSSNDASVYQKIGSDTNLGYQRSFSEASGDTAADLASSGVDPSSGKFKSQISALSDVEASVSADAKTRSQIAGQERYIDKMSNVMAMGQGEAQQAVNSLSDIAVNSQRKAMHDSYISSQNRNNTLSAIGAVGGAAMNYYTSTPSTDEQLPADNRDPFSRSV